MTSPQLGNSWRSTLLHICSQPPCPANLIMANDQFSKEGLKPQLSNSPFEKRGIKGDFSATSAAAIGCIFLNELWFQDTRKKHSNSQTTGPSDPGGWFVGRSSTCRRLSATHRRAYLRTNLDCARAASDIRESSTELSPRTPFHSAPPARSLQGGGYATVVLLPTPDRKSTRLN